jgi:hypothetical protein
LDGFQGGIALATLKLFDGLAVSSISKVYFKIMPILKETGYDLHCC